MNQIRVGLGYGALAYFIWGAFPFYFGLIAMFGPFEAVSWRVSMTLVFCALLTTFMGRWGETLRVIRNMKLLPWLLLSSWLLYLNWQIFVYGVMSGHVLETSLGYFINPLVTILLGVFIRKERLNGLQWIAIGIASVGLIVMTVSYGRVPWISLGLAFTFGIYGAVHKHVGARVDGVTGLTVETILSTPVALVQGVIIAFTVSLTAFDFGVWSFVLLLLSGLITAVPLILFGEAASRIPLIYIGFLQYITPILTFLYGYFLAGEEMSQARWVGFVSVWIALMLIITNMVREYRRWPGRGPVETPPAS